ncbi:MAG TPA: HEAT repeat domain-containing protein [Bacteroidia bacterium]|nr:HEAT repeat domain-containing protein [Bacteroidia bacterium]
MSFYSLSPNERKQLTEKINRELELDFRFGKLDAVLQYFEDEDTYVRKSAYLATGKIYFRSKALQKKILTTLWKVLESKDFRVRQSAINAAGEIGMQDFEAVQHFFDKGLFDAHHSPRNAVIGSVKKMGQKNPRPVMKWAKNYLKHPDKEVRREICHGIELRGRTHPQDILPLLKTLQHDKTARVRKTLVHVLGQIAYKKGCLATVIADLNKWENKALTDEAVDEIIDVFERYKNFASMSQEEAIRYIGKHYHK